MRFDGAQRKGLGQGEIRFVDRAIEFLELSPRSLKNNRHRDFGALMRGPETRVQRNAVDVSAGQVESREPIVV